MSLRSNASIIGLALTIALAGCSRSHDGAGEDDGSGPDSGTRPPGTSDGGGGVPLTDGGAFVPPTDGGSWTPPTDGGSWTPPTFDAGPPGDRAGDSWDGYIESYAFPSGSDRVRIIFDSASGDGPRTGIVIFGEGTPPPPPTDPNVGYPPGATRRLSDAMEGFEYPITEGSVSGARVTATISLSALYEEWCRLQMPFPRDASGTSWGCLPNTGGGSGPDGCFYNHPEDGSPVYVDCAKFEMCFLIPVCDCQATHCTASSGGEIRFDFRVDGDTAAGSVTLRELHNVYFTRVP